VGDWTFQAYTQAAGCPLDWTGTALEWLGGSGNTCPGLSLSRWRSIWYQDYALAVASEPHTAEKGLFSASR